MLQQDRLLLSVTEREQDNRIWFNKITCSRKCTLFPLRQHPFDFFIARKIHGMSRTGSSDYSWHSMKCSPQALLGHYCSHSLCYTTVSSRCVRINCLHSSLKFIKISTSEAGYGKWYRNWNFIIICQAKPNFECTLQMLTFPLAILYQFFWLYQKGLFVSISMHIPWYSRLDTWHNVQLSLL